MDCVRLFDLDTVGSSIAIKIAMLAITTSNSTKVNPFFFRWFITPDCLLENALEPARLGLKTPRLR